MNCLMFWHWISTSQLETTIVRSRVLSSSILIGWFKNWSEVRGQWSRDGAGEPNKKIELCSTVPKCKHHKQRATLEANVQNIIFYERCHNNYKIALNVTILTNLIEDRSLVGLLQSKMWLNRINFWNDRPVIVAMSCFYSYFENRHKCCCSFF